jgi:hypothetical protein
MKKYFKIYDRKYVIEVPEGYQSIAIDEDKSVWIYKGRPTRSHTVYGVWSDTIGCSKRIDIYPYCDHWTRSFRRLYPVKEG